MDDKRIEQAYHLLRIAADRQKAASGENAAFNLLSALHNERYETRTHSRIISFLLNDIGRSDGENEFLRLFLRVLEVPEDCLSENWKVYREMPFDGGRIDFVIESRSFCAIMEMKVDAADGDSQLNRYAAFGKRKRKKYRIYYLTPHGHRPEEQSAGGVDEDKLACISFEKEITSWLRDCLGAVDERGYKYSFIKQYLGAVNQICGTNDGVVTVTDLLDSSEMARAAQVVIESYHEKMREVTEEFFRKTCSIIMRKAKLEANSYGDSVDIILETFTCKRHTYHAILCPTISGSDEFVVCFGFTRKTGEGPYGYSSYMDLAEARSVFPSVYRKWIDRLESLDGLPRIRQSQRSLWFYAEDAQGDKLDFKDCSAQIKLIDEMDLQCGYICDGLIELVIKPLLAG